MPSVQESSQGIVFTVFVQPRSSKNMIAGIHGDALKIHLTAPPVGGAANKMCVAYLAKCLGVPKSSLEILSGHAGRTKRVLLKYKGKPLKSDRNRLKGIIERLAISKPDF